MVKHEMISHPVANCQPAWDLYKEWAEYKKGSKQYESACLRYKRHIAECDKCQEGLMNGG